MAKITIYLSREEYDWVKDQEEGFVRKLVKERKALSGGFNKDQDSAQDS
jgi:hypothetical protein